MTNGKGGSHAWKKMLEVREEVEHDILWQLKEGGVSFQYDNWTKQGALFYTKNQGAGEDEIEVKEVIRSGEWNEQKIRGLIFEVMIYFIVEHINPKHEEGEVDTPWWMGNCNGVSQLNLSMKTLDLRRRKNGGGISYGAEGFLLSIISCYGEDGRKNCNRR